jgi:hypothetical protein
MKTSIYHKSVLLVAGVTAIGIGGTILASPDVFYASYGIALASKMSASPMSFGRPARAW